MGLVVDLAYIVAAVATSPFWLVSMWIRGKLRTDWAARIGWALPQIPARDPAMPRRPNVLVHAVSVGEVNSIRILADRLASAPLHARVIVSVTTDTGIARARQLLGPRHTVVRFPFDLSWAMGRFIRRVDPDLVLLAELELWPNCTRMCERRAIPVAVINGRLSARSFRRSHRLRWILSPMFRRLAHVCAQDAQYAQRFAAMGVPTDRITVTGTMKWDTAEIADHVAGADDLAHELGIDRTRPLIVAGSTAPGEEALLHAACPPGAQLLCAPRKPEWFASAARALPGVARRSRGERGSASGRFLLDTIGELRKAYALADVVVMGRTFGILHGSDMMEPAALGKVVVVGPRVGDFQATADALIAGGGLVQTTQEDLPRVLAELLSDPARRASIARAARTVVAREQGASHRHAQLAERLVTAHATTQSTDPKGSR
ncbi:MAG: hypothetical protein EXS15_00245 [Phycisphaerales bacterium]|nr:hypothetical protein [Phycisphaerales bacterium]